MTLPLPPGIWVNMLLPSRIVGLVLLPGKVESARVKFGHEGGLGPPAGHGTFALWVKTRGGRMCILTALHAVHNAYLLACLNMWGGAISFNPPKLKD